MANTNKVQPKDEMKKEEVKVEVKEPEQVNDKLETSIEDVKSDTVEVKEETKVDVEKAADEVVTKEPTVEKPKTKTVEDKIDIVQNMMANTKKREADKQRFIYSAMPGIQIIRN